MIIFVSLKIHTLWGSISEYSTVGCEVFKLIPFKMYQANVRQFKIIAKLYTIYVLSIYDLKICQHVI